MGAFLFRVFLSHDVGRRRVVLCFGSEVFVLGLIFVNFRKKKRMFASMVHVCMSFHPFLLLSHPATNSLFRNKKVQPKDPHMSLLSSLIQLYGSHLSSCACGWQSFFFSSFRHFVRPLTYISTFRYYEKQTFF